MVSRWSSGEREQALRAVALLISVLAATIILWMLAKLFWLFMAREEASLDLPAASSMSNANATATVSVSKWHLFGNSEISTVLAPRNIANTTLKLSLRGTLALAEPRQGMAMIADDQGEHAYHVGEMVSEGARLDSVYPDHVIIVHEGVPETLQLPKPEENTVAAATPSIANNKIAASNPRQETISSTPTGNSVDLKQLQQKYRINPEELARQTQIVPVLENGKITGVRLNAGANAGLLTQMGLQPNDIVTAVNGAPVNNLSNPQQWLERLKNSPQLQVTIQRDGKPATLVVNLK